MIKGKVKLDLYFILQVDPRSHCESQLQTLQNSFMTSGSKQWRNIQGREGEDTENVL